MLKAMKEKLEKEWNLQIKNEYKDKYNFLDYSPVDFPKKDLFNPRRGDKIMGYTFVISVPEEKEKIHNEFRCSYSVLDDEDSTAETLIKFVMKSIKNEFGDDIRKEE